jgi:ribonucleoside-diphosphate reductase alpha chain
MTSTMNTSFDDEVEMYVTKRNGKTEVVSFDKILQRIKKVGTEVGIKINYTALTMKVIDQLYDKISTRQIDELTAEQCASMSSTHPDYNVLAGRITVSNHHKNTDASFTKVMNKLYNYKNKQGKSSPLISKELHQAIHELESKRLNALCDYSRDYFIDYFGFKTLERAYMMRIDKQIVERPQHMWLRVSIGIHGDNLDKVAETYHYMSQKFFTHATPTLFNAGTPHPQLSSCYLMSMEDDSIDGIFNTLKDCALISKWAGGIGLHIHNVRATGSHIHGTNGTSNGIVPMLKVFNNTAKYVDQCVMPETFIYTTKGPKRICDVVAHETSIMNTTGGVEVIQNVLEHSYDGAMLEIHTLHAIEPIQITPEHPIYALEKQETYSFEELVQGVKNGRYKPQFIEAKHITEGDYLISRIPHYENTTTNTHLTEEDCYMYGILYQRANPFNDIYTDDSHLISYITQYLEKKLVPFQVEQTTETNRKRIHWSKSDGLELPFRTSDFYNEMGEKCIAAKWLTLPMTKSEKIIQGILHSTDAINENACNIQFDTESKYSLESLKYLFLRAETPIKSMKKQNRYLVEVHKTPKICQYANIEYNVSYSDSLDFFVYDKYIYSQVSKIENTTYTGTLYDLQMEYVHDYMLSNGIVHNGGGKRNGSFAIYLEPWHFDIEIFLQMRKNHGDEELKARDLFYALWTPDLFMTRVKENGQWTLMCPSECPGLSDVHGPEFDSLYTKYEKEGRGRKTMPARDLWLQILDAQMETGTPYLLFKDAANLKSNQKNVGTIKSSNLCVTPETYVLTREGQFPIYSLWVGNHHISTQEEHRYIDVWNGQEYSTVEVMKTGENVQEFVRVECTDGSVLTCTPYHKFYIQDIVQDGDREEDSDDENTIEMEAKDLLDGMILQKSNFPVIEDGLHFPDGKTEAHTLGCESGMHNIRLEKENAHLENIFVPVNHCLEDKLAWFYAFLEPYIADEVIERDTIIYLPSRSFTFTQDMKLMLQTCGVNVVIRKVKKHDNGVKRILYQLAIHICQIRQLLCLDKQFAIPNIDCNYKLSRAEKTYTPEVCVQNVVKIENKTEDTYCFTEPKAHAGIFNGMRTGQCTEIIEYSDENETAVCNLASIALPSFIQVDEKTNTKTFDYELLHEIAKVVTSNLNRIIDVNYYPTEKTRVSNMRHRPIGIGIQGLADVFLQMGWSFSCEEAKTLNKYVFETIYHASLERSCELAQEEGKYETFDGSPASKGILQFDMWDVVPDSGRYDWDHMKTQIKTHGLRNSLLLAPMPTASTSQILGYNECMEPITSNIYSRRTLAGEFILVNKYLMNEMLEKGMWNETLKNHMVANNGSIQTIDYIPQEIRDKYKTVWEIPMRDLIDMAADRGAYICQSQSLNLWLEDPNYGTMTSMHFYSWSKGLKTGIYYLRRRPRHQAQQFTIEPEKRQGLQQSAANEEICEMCSA